MSEEFFRPPSDIPQDIINLVPESFAFEHRVIPYKAKKKKGKTTVYLAVTDKNDMYTIDNLRFVLNSKIKSKIVTQEWMDEALKKYYIDRQWFEKMKDNVDRFLSMATDEQLAEVLERANRQWSSCENKEIIQRLEKLEEEVSTEPIPDGE